MAFARSLPSARRCATRHRLGDARMGGWGRVRRQVRIDAAGLGIGETQVRALTRRATSIHVSTVMRLIRGRGAAPLHRALESLEPSRDRARGFSSSGGGSIPARWVAIRARDRPPRLKRSTRVCFLESQRRPRDDSRQRRRAPLDDPAGTFAAGLAVARSAVALGCGDPSVAPSARNDVRRGRWWSVRRSSRAVPSARAVVNAVNAGTSACSTAMRNASSRCSASARGRGGLHRAP